MSFGTTPMDHLGTPLGSVYVPGTASSNLTALEGINASTDSNGQISAAARMGMKDGDSATLGTTTQAKATDATTTSWSAIQLLKGILNSLFTTVAVTQSGNWNARTEDGSGNAITSTGNALDVNLKTSGVSSLTVAQGSGASAGTSWRTKGDFTEQASLSAGSLNADLVASTDMSTYKMLSLHVTGTWSGNTIFPGSPMTIVTGVTTST